MTTSAIRVEGLDDVLEDLNKDIAGIKTRTRKGMITAGLLIQRKAQLNVPVDFGNLRASAFTIWSQGGSVAAQFEGEDSASMSMEHARVVKNQVLGIKGNALFDLAVIVGFSAAYALYVHEDMTDGQTARGTLRKPKFLEKAFVANKEAILFAIQNEAWKDN